MSMSFKFELLEHIGTISEQGSYTKEVNIVSWGGRPAKWDIRGWAEDHGSAGKGIALTEQEAKQLYEILKGRFDNESIKG